MLTDRELAYVAFQGWFQNTHTRYRPDVRSMWDRQGEDIQKLWESVAVAVREEVRREQGTTESGGSGYERRS